MRQRSGEAAAGGGIAAKLFIVAWLAVQLVLPFLMKFELGPVRYHWAPMAWGMYANPTAEFKVTMYRIGAGGSREAIDLEGTGDTPWPRGRLEGETTTIRRIEFLRAVEMILRRVARRERDGATYVGRVDWYYVDEGRSRSQEIRVQAPGA